MSRFLKERLQGFDSYTPGEQPKDTEYIKLNTNESPYPPSPEVISRLKETDFMKLRLYPDPTGCQLKTKLAGLYGLEKENIFISNGSDDILNFAMMAFNGDDDVTVIPDITYSFYKSIMELHDISYETIPLRDDFSINAGDYVGLCKNIIIPNPNAPTGLTLSLSEIEEIVSSNPDNVVLIDEAYVDFGAQSAAGLVRKYDNLLVSQTFSKSRSFAGGRLGFAIGSPELISDLALIQYSTNPYNVNNLSLILAEAAVDSNDYYMKNCRHIEATREWTSGELEKLGFRVIPSKANFVFASHPEVSGDDIYRILKEKGILVRHFTQDRIRDYNRISIGTDEQMEMLVVRMKEILSESQSKGE